MMIEKISADFEDDTIVVDSFDLEFDDIVEFHPNMFWTLLDSIRILLSIIVFLVEFGDGRCSCL